MSEVKEYVSVNDKEFGKKESLKLTVNGKILDANLQKIVDSKVADLNAKIDQAYNVDGFNLDKGTNKIGESERKILVEQLKKVVEGFNQEIARIEQEYIGRTKDNQGQIRSEISEYFSDKSIFVEKGAGLASALKGYASMDADAAKPHREKELPLR